MYIDNILTYCYLYQGVTQACHNDRRQILFKLIMLSKIAIYLHCYLLLYVLLTWYVHLKTRPVQYSVQYQAILTYIEIYVQYCATCTILKYIAQQNCFILLRIVNNIDQYHDKHWHTNCDTINFEKLFSIVHNICQYCLMLFAI